MSGFIAIKKGYRAKGCFTALPDFCERVVNVLDIHVGSFLEPLNNIDWKGLLEPSDPTPSPQLD